MNASMLTKPVQPSVLNKEAHGYMNTTSISKTTNRIAVRYSFTLIFGGPEPSVSLPHSNGMTFPGVGFVGPRKWPAQYMPAQITSATPNMKNIGRYCASIVRLGLRGSELEPRASREDPSELGCGTTL